MLVYNMLYVPCLRWKQGEYQAVLNLSDHSKKLMTPLIEVPEIGFDFEKKIPVRSIDKHLEPFGKRVKTKWGLSSCFVDLRLIEANERVIDGIHPLEYVFDDLRSKGCLAIPVTGLDRDQAYQNTIKNIVSIDSRGLCIRLNLEETEKTDLTALLNEMLSENNVDVSECDLILDLKSPNFEPIDRFAKVIVAITERLPLLQKWRSFTILGSSFPSSMAGIDKGSTLIPRHEWVLYKKIITQLSQDGFRTPTFGDYGIHHPDTMLPMDMRFLKPSATVKYAVEDAWLIVKGKNIRDHGNPQYRDHCNTVMRSSGFKSEQFSHGDWFIVDCVQRNGKLGNQTTWVKVGVNHHLERVVDDLSNLFSS